MEESSITRAGLQVTTYERSGISPPLFFVHGNSSSAMIFEDVWHHPALREYRVISLDLPGHGKSGLAKDASAYSIPFLGKLIAGTINERNLQEVILIGHSIGGHIALSALNFTDRVAGIALAGTAPLSGIQDLSRAYIISDAVQTVFKADATENEILAFCRNALYREEKMGILVRDFKNTDRRFREVMGLELGRHFGSENFLSEIELLKKGNLAVCLIHGQEEKVVNGDYLHSIEGLNLFDRKVHIIADAGHCVPLESPDEYSRILARFAEHLAQVAA